MKRGASGGQPSSRRAAETGGAREFAAAPFRLFVEAVQDYAIFMLDPEGHVTTWNKGAERIKGYRREEILGKHFSVFYTEEARRQGHPARELEIARDRGSYEEEGWRVREDGSRFWASVTITAVRDERARLIGFGKVTRDLTERKRQEERQLQLQREQTARAEAEAANRAKSQFLAAMSHELRTPLNAIVGYVDLIELGIQGPLTEDQTRSLERIRASSGYLLGLINDVLNFARIEARRIRYRFRDVDVNDALAAVEPLLATQFAEKDISFTLRRCEAGLTLRADPVKAQQILINLLTNAYKFTGCGGRVSVACEADRTSVHIRVRDTGPGISPEALESIFDPFVQVDRRPTQASQQGMGLGLAISRDLARGMNGELRVESEIGVGSIFTLTLPRSTERSAPPTDAERTDAGGTP